MRLCFRNGLWAAAAVLACGGIASLTHGQVLQGAAGQTPTASKPLNIGDPAPALDIAEWVKGTPVKSFEKGHTYVVEFWATWCGPCIAGIPKLSELQTKYADKKVTVIGVSIDQSGMTAITPFMGKTGKKMEYTVALDKGGTVQSYMAAVGKGGIPYAFVVDAQGKVAWHGHPAEGLELVVMESAAGKFDAVKHPERIAKFRELDGKFSAAMQEKKWDECEKILDEIAVIRPDIANNLLVTHYWIKSGGKNDPTGAFTYAEKIAANELKDDGEMLMLLADKVVGSPTATPKELQFGTSLARRAVELTKGKNATAHVILSEGLKREGKYEEALAAAQKAVDATEEEMEKRYYGDRLTEIRKLKDDAAKAAEPKPTEPAKP